MPEPDLPSDDLSIASMAERDLEEVTLIERVSFKAPWAPQTFHEELQKPFARVDVVRRQGRVIGFANYWLVADEASLLSIAVHPDHRQRGVAARLLAHLIDVARRAGCARVLLEVRRHNAPAIALYERFGFATFHVRKQYYSDGEDALLMQRGLAPT
jgi:[ribosomal protein S18]-alanine N-acetyltransferase